MNRIFCILTITACTIWTAPVFARGGGHGGGHSGGGHSGGGHSGGHAHSSSHAAHSSSHTGSTHTGHTGHTGTHTHTIHTQVHTGQGSGSTIRGHVSIHDEHRGFGNSLGYFPWFGNLDYVPVVPSADVYPGADPVVPQTNVPAACPIRLEVIVPDAQAKVWINGALTTSTGTMRVYVTPPVETGYTYQYAVRASWILNGQEVAAERQVDVVPCTTTRVEFTNAGARPVNAGLPAPQP